MKRISAILLLLLSGIIAQAQTDTTYWNKGGQVGVNVNQSTLQNWAAGGTSSVSGSTFLSLIADYKKDRQFWKNSLDLGYGLIQEEGRDAQKTEDKIVFISNYGRQLAKEKGKWFASALVDFRTQFYRGYEIDEEDESRKLISNFVAPAYLTTSLGLDWSPTDYLTVKFGLLTSKMTFVNDDSLSAQGAYGVDPNEKFRFEGGGMLGVNFNKEVLENVQYISNLVLFSNYAEHPDRIDVNWENTLNMKVNSFLTVNIFNQIIYDYDVKFDVVDDVTGELIDQEEKIQFKNILGLGLSYKFGGARGKK